MTLTYKEQSPLSIALLFLYTTWWSRISHLPLCFTTKQLSMKLKALTIKVEFFSESGKTKPAKVVSRNRVCTGVIELIKKIGLKVKGF